MRCVSGGHSDALSTGSPRGANSSVMRSLPRVRAEDKAAAPLALGQQTGRPAGHRSLGTIKRLGELAWHLLLKQRPVPASGPVSV